MPPNATGLRPPVPYYGGKQRLAGPIVELLSGVAHRHYVEPYAGSLAVLLEKSKGLATLAIVLEPSREIVVTLRM